MLDNSLVSGVFRRRPSSVNNKRCNSYQLLNWIVDVIFPSRLLCLNDIIFMMLCPWPRENLTVKLKVLYRLGDSGALFPSIASDQHPLR
jgi:hypothetical protein